jgi:hypothetical protein
MPSAATWKAALPKSRTGDHVTTRFGLTSFVTPTINDLWLRRRCMLDAAVGSFTDPPVDPLTSRPAGLR